MTRKYTNAIKERVCNLRAKGYSLGEICIELKIPKNTISGWVKGIQLSKTHKERIKQKIISSSAIGRPLALAANRRKLEQWRNEIKERVKHFARLATKNEEIEKVICGILYACEGGKYPSSRFLYFGNSDPQMVVYFLSLLRKHYHIDENKLRFNINYRWDQDYEKLKSFWSRLTKIPKSKCLKSKPDIRTKGKPTLKKDYRGVCKIAYYSTTLQLELQSIGEAN